MVDTDSQCLVLVPQQGHQGFKRFTDALADGGKFFFAELLPIGIGLVENK